MMYLHELARLSWRAGRGFSIFDRFVLTSFSKTLGKIHRLPSLPLTTMKLEVADAKHPSAVFSNLNDESKAK